MEEGKNCLVGALGVGMAVALVISAIAWPIAWYNQTTTVKMMEMGYEEKAIPAGQVKVVLVKKGVEP